MSRIEDNEAERAERLAQERKLQDKAVDTKRVADARQFSQVVAQMQQSKGQNARQDAQKEQDKQAASRTLMARNGIANNDAQGSLLGRNNRLNDEGRRLLQQKDGERARGREDFKNDHKPKTATSGETRAVGGGAKQGKEGKPQGQGQDDRRVKGETAAPTGMQFAQQVHATANAVTGIGGRTGALGSGAPASLTAKEVIDHIVSHVRAGMDSKGFGLIQIDLRDDILAGSRLTFLSSQSGVHLKVDTGDQDVERLMSSGQTAHELTVAMQRADIKLTGLEVNGTRVLG